MPEERFSITSRDWIEAHLLKSRGRSIIYCNSILNFFDRRSKFVDSNFNAMKHDFEVFLPNIKTKDSSPTLSEQSTNRETLYLFKMAQPSSVQWEVAFPISTLRSISTMP